MTRASTPGPRWIPCGRVIARIVRKRTTAAATSTTESSVPMTCLRHSTLLVIASVVLLAGCATRPVNPPITQVEPGTGYRYDARQSRALDTGKEAMVILAFSGGGTRA